MTSAQLTAIIALRDVIFGGSTTTYRSLRSARIKPVEFDEVASALLTFLAPTIDTDLLNTANEKAAIAGASGTAVSSTNKLVDKAYISGYRSVSINATLNALTDLFLEVDATDGNRTVSVPSAITNAGKAFIVKKTDSSANYVAVTGFVAGQMIDGIEYHYLRSQYSTIMIYSDGANWKIVAKYPSIAEGTPVNAVASSKVLTVAATPAEGETITIGDVVYKARLDALGAGVAATGSLVFSNLPVEDNTIILGNTTYRLRDTLAQANDIKIGATAELTIDNIVLAVEGTGVEGTNYFAGTVSQGAVTSSKSGTDTLLITYDSVGFLGNQYDTLGTITNAVWGAAALVGGIDPQAANDVFVDTNAEGFIDNLVLAITAGAGIGTNYGTGTVVHPTVTAAKASASTMTATAKTKGVAGDLIALAESLGNASSKWALDATFLGGGVNGTVGGKTDVYKDNTYLYIPIAANTVSDTNWRRIALGSAY